MWLKAILSRLVLGWNRRTFSVIIVCTALFDWAELSNNWNDCCLWSTMITFDGFVFDCFHWLQYSGSHKVCAIDWFALLPLAKHAVTSGFYKVSWSHSLHHIISMSDLVCAIRLISFIFHSSCRRTFTFQLGPNLAWAMSSLFRCHLSMVVYGESGWWSRVSVW